MRGVLARAVVRCRSSLRPLSCLRSYDCLLHPNTDIEVHVHFLKTEVGRALGSCDSSLLSSSLRSQSVPTQHHVQDTTSLLLSAALWSVTALPGSQEHLVTMIHHLHLVLEFLDCESNLGKNSSDL